MNAPVGCKAGIQTDAQRVIAVGKCQAPVVEQDVGAGADAQGGLGRAAQQLQPLVRRRSVGGSEPAGLIAVGVDQAHAQLRGGVAERYLSQATAQREPQHARLHSDRLLAIEVGAVVGHGFGLLAVQHAAR